MNCVPNASFTRNKKTQLTKENKKLRKGWDFIETAIDLPLQ